MLFFPHHIYPFLFSLFLIHPCFKNLRTHLKISQLKPFLSTDKEMLVTLDSFLLKYYEESSVIGEWATFTIREIRKQEKLIKKES